MCDKKVMDWSLNKLVTCPNNEDDPHTCPYQQEIHDDSDFQCTCCESCKQECADDI